MKSGKTTDRQTERQIENETDTHTSRLERGKKHNDSDKQKEKTTKIEKYY